MIILLTGPNEFLITQQLIGLMAQSVSAHGEHSVERISGDDIAPVDLPALLQGTSLFAPERLLVLQGAGKNKSLWESLGDWVERMPADTTLVIVEPQPDKRTKTYKQLAKHAQVREFTELPEPALLAWLQQAAENAGSTLDIAVARKLLAFCGSDQWRLSNELQKLSGYPVISAELIDELVEPSLQVSAFELLDAAFARKPDKVAGLLSRLASDEDPYRLFGLLAGQVHAVALASQAGGRSPEQIAQLSGLHPFVVRKAQGVSRRLKERDVHAMVEAVAQCDDRLKTTGADPWLLVGECMGKIAAE